MGGGLRVTTRASHCARVKLKRNVPAISALARMRIMTSITFMFGWVGFAEAQGITFGGSGRDYPYPNEPQYQYPYRDSRGRDVNRCPRGQAPYQGKCRHIRWLPGAPIPTHTR
jgi:hypothetical protein